MTNANINFGKIKDIYNEILAESITTKDTQKKTEFKKYVKTLKENEALKTQFHIYNNIENKYDENRARAVEFIKENIALMDKFSKKEISEATKSLANDLITESEDLYTVSDKVKQLHEDISELINTEKNVSTVGGIVETTHRVAKYITENEPVEVDSITESLEGVILSNKELGSLMVSKYNQEYSTLSEGEKEILKLVLESGEDGREELYTKTISECLGLVNGKLETADADLKMSLLSLKENLLENKYIKESFESDMIKALELKNNLI